MREDDDGTYGIYKIAFSNQALVEGSSVGSIGQIERSTPGALTKADALRACQWRAAESFAFAPSIYYVST